MNNTNKTIIIVAIATLLAGFGIGWLIFSNEPSQSHDHTTENINQTWTCSMHPQIRQTEEGQCPICGMDLIPVNTGNDDNESILEIKMSPTAMQLASVQTAVIRKEKPVKKLRLNGKVQADERYVSSQASHISGRIEKLLVTYTGEYIRKGQVIAYVYSPELVTAQEELFEANKIKSTQPGLFIAAREKLKNWKLTNKQIDGILENGKPTEDFPILSDLTGVVTVKKVDLGDHVMQGASLFEVANLSKLWILFDIYESDMTWVKIGDEIEYQVQSLSGEKFKGIVSFIDPVINPKTRVAKARITTSNKGKRLKPEMFVTGILNSPFKNEDLAIIVPKSAVMWTGERSVVYVKSNEINGVNFMMREVILGSALGDRYMIMEGLEEGEEIAINGTFSIDAAAQLAGKPSMMNPEGGTTVTGHNHGNMPNIDMNNVATESKKTAIGNDAKKALAPLFKSYFEMKEALSNDNLNNAKEAGIQMNTALAKVNMSLFKGGAHDIWMKQSIGLQSSLQHIEHMNTIDEVRNNFMYISNNMIATAESFNPASDTLYVKHCPMANANKGANWLSRDKEMHNPYFGASMSTCGETTKTLK